MAIRQRFFKTQVVWWTNPTHPIDIINFVLHIDHFGKTMYWITEELWRRNDSKGYSQNDDWVSSTETIENVVIPYGL